MLGRRSQKLEVRSQEERLRRIERVYSHPKALAQCGRFFRGHPWMEAVEYFDTAGAARDLAIKLSSKVVIKQKEARREAAIASEAAGRIYGLEVLAREVADKKDNVTRFVGVEMVKGWLGGW